MELGVLQEAIMEVVWKLGEATVQDVLSTLGSQRRKQPAYTTILSVMQKLEKAGWLTHRSEGRAYVYIPQRSRREEGSSALTKLIDRVFSGDPVLLFEHLLDSDELTDAELTALRQMIDRRRKELADE